MASERPTEPEAVFCPWCGAYDKGNPCSLCRGKWASVKPPTQKCLASLGWVPVDDDADDAD